MDPRLRASKKVLLISSEFPPGPGGIGNHAFSLSKGLAKKGLEVFVVCDADYATPEDVEAFDRMLPKNMNVKRVIRSGFKTYLRRITYSRRIIRDEKIDRVIVSGRFSLWSGGFLKLIKPHIRVVAILHGSELQGGDFIKRRLTDWAIGKADILVPVSEFTHSLLSGLLKKRPFQIIPNGIDTSEFAELDQQSKQISVQGQPALLTVGNVTPRKGQHRLIKALPELIKSFPGVHYHIVGLPTTRLQLEKLAEKLGVRDRVTFHGRLKERKMLADLYKSTDCFVILSENQQSGDVEGFGIVVLEANFFGLPAIGALGCGVEAAVKNNFNGMLVNGDQPKEISKALEIILKSKEEFSENAMKWADQHDWNGLVERYINVLD